MLKTVLESLDGLDEAIKSLYAETDGKFFLKVDGIDQHPDVVNLKSAYERTKADKVKIAEERDALKTRTSSIPDDFDPEKWEQIKAGKPDEAALAKVRQTLEAEVAAAVARAEAAEQKALQSAIDRDLMDALTSSGVTNATFAKAARVMLAPHVKVSEDGKSIADTDMGPMPLAEYVKRWAAKEGKDFVTPASGGGAKPGSGAGVKKWSEMSGAEKVALHRSNPEEYERSKAAG